MSRSPGSLAFVCILIVAAALPTAILRADDTDIYLNPSAPAGGEPLVMFVLDWRPNLAATVNCAVDSYCATLREEGFLDDGHSAASGATTTFFDVLRAVLAKVVDPLGGVRVGFMLSHAYKNNCAGFPPKSQCSNGAYVPMGFRLMTDDSDDANKKLFRERLAAIPLPKGNASHPFQGKEIYFELFRYLTGQAIYNGHNGYIDFGDAPNDENNLDIDRPAIAWDKTIETGPAEALRYLSPLADVSGCSKIYVINLMFQVAQQDSDSDAAIVANKAAGGMQGINLSGSSNTLATVVRYMNDADLADGSFGTAPILDGKQNVISYFVVDPRFINVTTSGYAAAGGTGVPLPLSEDPAALIDTLDNIFKSILSVSTTFVAPSIPVNVFNRAQIVNEIYLALFEADENGLPFWPGNLKKLAIGDNLLTGVPELQDVQGDNAIDIDGRLKHTALTYWTAAAALPPPTGLEVEGADGRSIKRGGAGQKIPGYISGNPGLSNADSDARKLFTEDPTNLAQGLMPLDADAATAAALWSDLTARWTPATSASAYSDAATAEQQAAILDLRHVRGFAAATFADTATLRPWLLGDPLHSRPRPINYGARGGYTEKNPDIRILMATTDGILHLFTNTHADGGQSGAESWGFLPRQALAGQNRLRLGVVSNAPVHPIHFDGSPAVYQLDSNSDGTIDPTDGDRVYAFIGQRRGGKAYYALDLSAPDEPRFLWRIDPSVPAFAELGQTWSTPSIGRIDTGAGLAPVLVFGGGYNGDDDGDNEGDLGKDAANRNGAYGTDDDEGNALFVVNAETGALVWKAVRGVAENYDPATKTYTHPSLTDSIPADVATADMDGNGALDRVYFGDSGGRVWRADLDGADRSTWRLTILLDAGRHFNAGATNDLRFFNRPDLVRSRDMSGNFDAVLIGSGDREHPRGTTTFNRFFMIKDRAISNGSPATTPLTPDDLADLTVDCVTAGDCDAATIDNLGMHGWSLGLESAGEKNLAAAVTAGGTVFFTTFVPSPPSGSCGLSEGGGFVYAVNLQDATAVYNFDIANDIDGLALDRRDALGSGGIPVEVVPIGDKYVLIQGQEVGKNVQSVNPLTNWSTYWYEVPN